MSELQRLIDELFMSAVMELRRPWLTQAATDITALGSLAVLTLYTIIFAWIMLTLGKIRPAAQMLLAGAGGLLFSNLLKFFFERSRPPIAVHLVEAGGFSFPSGHSFSAAAVYLTLAILAARIFRTRHQRTAIFSLAVLVMALVGLTRIYLGVHYPTDVLAGMTVGAMWALLLNHLMNGSQKASR